MLSKYKNMLKGSAITLLVCGGLFGAYQVHNYYQINHPAVISADSSVYQKARRNDLSYLHHGGNKEACLANWQHAEYKYKTTNSVKLSHDDVFYFYKHDKIYKPDKHGNYWSYFETHQSLMNDDPTGKFAPSSFSGTTWSSEVSGILANEKVLRNHGVHSGVNFVYNKSDVRY